METNILELEIAELQKKIEEKKNVLEQQGGIIEEKELVSAAVREMVLNTPVVTQPVVGATAHTTQAMTNQTGSYLDHLDEQTADLVTELIQKVPTEGITKTVQAAELAGPFVIDAFHDALVDRLYDELKSRGIVG